MSEQAHPSVKSYLYVFGALLVLTLVTVGVSYWHLPPGPAVAVGMAIATFKAALVAAIFMHLKGERPIIYFFIGLTGFFLVVLFTIPLWDNSDLSARSTHTVIAMDEHEGAGHEAHEPAPAPEAHPAKAARKASRKGH